MNAETYERLAEAAPALLATFTSDGLFRWVNASWERETGWQRAELRGTEFTALLHPEERRTFGAFRDEAAGATPAQTRRGRVQRRDGTWCWIDWFVRPVGDGLLYARNVTAVRVAERELSRQLELMRMAEDLSGVGSWTLDVGSATLHWSPQVFRIYGLDPALGPPSLEDAVAAYHPDDRARVSAVVQEAMREGKPFSFELRFIRADQSVRTVVSQGLCQTDPVTGATETVFGTFQDVTDRDEARDQLARQQRLITTGMLAAGVGHEMNNPLTHMQMHLELLNEELQALAGASPSGRLRQLVSNLEEALAASGRLKKIVRGLRSFAREDDVPVAVDVASCIDMSVNMAMHEIRQTARCVVSVEPVPFVSADESRLAQVLVNLLVNAAHSFSYSDPEHNRITISAVRRGDAHVAISVTDNGSGMSEAVASQIFEPFFTTKPVGQGTGLGLAIAQSIIESLGGTITCHSRAGRGSTFTVILRTFDEQPQLVAAADGGAADSAPPERGRVVIVDDEEALGRVLSRVLRSAVADVEYCADPRVALTRLLDGPPTDLVLCDLSMPYLNGEQLYRAVREQRPALAERFVFMSGGATDDALRTFLNTVVNERLDKPFQMANVRLMARRIAARQDPG